MEIYKQGLSMVKKGLDVGQFSYGQPFNIRTRCGRVIHLSEN
jgi:hypothetical protein